MEYEDFGISLNRESSFSANYNQTQMPEMSNTAHNEVSADSTNEAQASASVADNLYRGFMEPIKDNPGAIGVIAFIALGLAIAGRKALNTSGPWLKDK